MLQKLVEFVLDNWGNLASVIGVGLSLFALIFARRASVAAKEAREAVLRRNLAQDIADAGAIAADVYNFVDSSRYDSAITFCTQLQTKTIYLMERHKGRVGEMPAQKLTSVLAQLEVIQKVLGKFARNAGPPNAVAADRLLESCRAVRLTYTEQHALAARSVEGDEK
jgi:hypothetical protein